MVFKFQYLIELNGDTETIFSIYALITVLNKVKWQKILTKQKMRIQ